MSYAPNQADLFRRAADFVDKIDHLFGVLFMYRDAIPSSADSPGELFHLWMLSPQVCAKLGYIGETWSTL
ncbi:MAG: hypothetical protein HW397_205 [Dehalococcoidia bacterium]|nr:hypothetical protein [Dehalococcoidia bacterium]